MYWTDEQSSVVTSPTTFSAVSTAKTKMNTRRISVARTSTSAVLSDIFILE
ncbi:MAG: hypothetical protein IKW03_07040 [Clostridia bacterium]|nr:hypothetical protein [Clostridia bacterium]